MYSAFNKLLINSTTREMKDLIDERVVSRQSDEMVEEYISLEAEPYEESNQKINLDKLKSFEPDSEGAKLLENMMKA